MDNYLALPELLAIHVDRLSQKIMILERLKLGAQRCKQTTKANISKAPIKIM